MQQFEALFPEDFNPKHTTIDMALALAKSLPSLTHESEG